MQNRKPIIDQVATRYPEMFQDTTAPYAANTHEHCAQFLYACCEELARAYPLERWGLLSKDDGENGYTWPAGLRTSIDALCLPNGERVDVIGAAADVKTRPTTSWNVIPPGQWRPNNVWLHYESVMDEPLPTPEPPPAGGFPPYEALGGDAAGNQFGSVLFGDYAAAGETPNPAMGTWFWRTMYDALHDATVNGTDPSTALARSTAKHRDEWCSVLGIPVSER